MISILQTNQASRPITKCKKESPRLKSLSLGFFILPCIPFPLFPNFYPLRFHKKIFFFLGLMALLFLVGWPRPYEVSPFVERPGTQYWNLKTGSRIGYTLINPISESRSTPIIYLHGGPGGMIKNEIIEKWKPLAEAGFPIYFYDQVGSGHSNRLEDIKEYTVARHQRDLAEIIDKIGSEKVILLGQSWGATLAMNYVQEWEEKIEKIILTGPGPILPWDSRINHLLPPDSLDLKKPKFSNKEANDKVSNWHSKLMTFCANKLGIKLASDQTADAFFTQLNTALNKSTSCEGSKAKSYPGGSGYYVHLRTVKSFQDEKDQKSKLKELPIPTLILRGQCDNQPWGFTQEYLHLLPNVQLEILENTGHGLLEVDRVYLNKLVLGFLE